MYRRPSQDIYVTLCAQQAHNSASTARPRPKCGTAVNHVNYFTTIFLHNRLAGLAGCAPRGLSLSLAVTSFFWSDFCTEKRRWLLLLRTCKAERRRKALARPSSPFINYPKRRNWVSWNMQLCRRAISWPWRARALMVPNCAGNCFRFFNSSLPLPSSTFGLLNKEAVFEPGRKRLPLFPFWVVHHDARKPYFHAWSERSR